MKMKKKKKTTENYPKETLLSSKNGRTKQQEIDMILKFSKEGGIAVVGISPKTSRDSNEAMGEMIRMGYNCIGVNPKESTILDRPCYPTISSIPNCPAVINVFRRSEAIPGIVKECIQNMSRGVKAIWLQEGVQHADAEERAKRAGLHIVSDICIKKEAKKLRSGHSLVEKSQMKILEKETEKTRGSPEYVGARERMKKAGYNVDDAIMQKVHCPLSSQYSFEQNGFIQTFITINGKKSRVIDFAPGQQLQPHRHDADEKFVIKGGKVFVCKWLTKEEGKGTGKWVKAGSYLEVPNGTPHALYADPKLGVQFHEICGDFATRETVWLDDNYHEEFKQLIKSIKTDKGKKDAGELIVAYWAIRGLAAPLRMICEYSEAKWTPVNYNAGDPLSPNYKEVWLNHKPEIEAKNPFVNLPYIENESIVICQSNACLIYLGRKFKLLGKDDSEEIKAKQCLDQIMDLRNAMVKFFYSQDLFEKTKDTFITTQVLPHVQKMENWLLVNNTIYCASNTPCVADFHLWELIDQLEMFSKCYKQESVLKGKPKLEALYSKIRSLEQLSNYFNGDLYTLPVNNPTACWKGYKL